MILTNTTVPELANIIIRAEERSVPFFMKDIALSKKLFVEIGFGNGEFPVHLALSRADAIVVGMEVSLTCVLKAAARAVKAGAGNVYFMRGDARFLLRECFRDSSVDVVYMNFPCPWPKSRHSKRRVTNPAFADAIASVLKTNAYFELLTDEEWYADEVIDTLGTHPALRTEEHTINPNRPVTTKYERKWLEMGKEIHLVRIGKTRDFSSARTLHGGNDKVHIKIDAGKITLARLRTFLDAQGSNGGAHWVYKESFANGDGVFIMEVISSDEGFEQKFFIRISQSERGTVLKLAEPGTPFRTPAVKQALYCLAEKLRSGESC